MYRCHEACYNLGMSVIFQLYRLQQTDTQSDHVKARIRKIDALLADDSSLRRAEEEAAQAAAALQTTQDSLKGAEDAVASHKVKIELNQHNLYGGKVINPKELQDLQNESQALQRHLRVLEDQQLELMIAVEELSAKYDGLHQKTDEIRAENVQHSSLLRGEKGNLEDTLKHLESERQVIISSIPSTLVEQFDILRKKKGGVAVARIQNNACSACGAVLNATLIHTVRNTTQPVSCDGCGRMLFGG
jgi:predicted  nucleic acid-binding Zn-ribbon protein